MTGKEVDQYMKEVENGKHPRMSAQEIYNELSGLTVMELCEELSTLLDVVNTIAED